MAVDRCYISGLSMETTKIRNVSVKRKEGKHINHPLYHFSYRLTTWQWSSQKLQTQNQIELKYGFFFPKMRKGFLKGDSSSHFCFLRIIKFASIQVIVDSSIFTCCGNHKRKKRTDVLDQTRFCFLANKHMPLNTLTS